MAQHDEGTGSAGEKRKLEIIRKGTAGRAARVPTQATEEDVRTWLFAAAEGAASKTDSPTIILDVGEVLNITTWFVISGGRNPRQVKTVVDTVEEFVEVAGGPKPLRVEGLDSLDWVVMDYGDFVVHVFHDDARAYYELERLYKDVPVVEWRAVGEAAPG